MNDRRLVHVVDDDEAIRRSVGFMLRTAGFDVIAHASGTAFLAAAGSAREGCVLLDIRMPGMDGLEVQRQLAARGIAFPVIMLTGHGDVTLAVRAIKAGAVEFLEKPFEKARLLSAVEEAFDRLLYAGKVDLNAAEAIVRLAALTPRERDVLEGLVRGQPNKITAHDLGITTRTVEVHRSNLMHKLKVRSLSDVLRLSFAAGLGSDKAE